MHADGLSLPSWVEHHTLRNRKDRTIGARNSESWRCVFTHTHRGRGPVQFVSSQPHTYTYTHILVAINRVCNACKERLAARENNSFNKNTNHLQILHPNALLPSLCTTPWCALYPLCYLPAARFIEHALSWYCCHTLHTVPSSAARFSKPDLFQLLLLFAIAPSEFPAILVPFELTVWLIPRLRAR